MRLLLAVLDDLLSFARTAFFGELFEKRDIALLKIEGISSAVIDHRTTQLALPGHDFSLEQEATDVASLPSTNMAVGASYFIGTPDAHLYVDPVVSFDGIVQTLAYGEMVTVSKFGGRWAMVQVGNIEGWIFKDALREQVTDVFPILVEDIVYSFDNPQTQMLRMCIRDSFAGGVAEVPLTDVEYVTYALSKRNISITWPTVRPRVAGAWQKILRGKHGIHIGITPKTDTVMEYAVDDIGHVCYVEAVFSDETIKVRGIGLLEEGVLSVLMLGKEEWRELRPVFIEVA